MTPLFGKAKETHGTQHLDDPRLGEPPDLAAWITQLVAVLFQPRLRLLDCRCVGIGCFEGTRKPELQRQLTVDAAVVAGLPHALRVGHHAREVRAHFGLQEYAPRTVGRLAHDDEIWVSEVGEPPLDKKGGVVDVWNPGWRHAAGPLNRLQERRDPFTRRSCDVRDDRIHNTALAVPAEKRTIKAHLAFHFRHYPFRGTKCSNVWHDDPANEAAIHRAC